MKRRYVIGGVIATLLVALFALPALATDAEMFFASDKNGANRVTMIQEGDEIWIAVYDPDQNKDCDLRDKMSPDIKIMDPKTGAYIVWDGRPDLVDPVAIMAHDYLEETGNDTGLFVSHRSFKVGEREDFDVEEENTHVVDVDGNDFQWGGYIYDTEPGNNDENVVGDDRGWIDEDGIFEDGVCGAADGNILDANDDGCLPADVNGQCDAEYVIGRFENMDTLVGLYQDPNDDKDVACAMGKIIDIEATISWDQEIYKDDRGTATITVVDPDENLNCNEVEWVPVFIIVNPGSWNPVQTDSPNSFCMLKRTGGIDPVDGNNAEGNGEPIRWWNIYNSHMGVTFGAGNQINNSQPTNGDPYVMEYPTTGDDNVTSFATTDDDGHCRVSFYAQETGVNTGVFQLNLNHIKVDLGFDELDVNDVLVAYYLDPNDFDDFKLAVAYIEESSCASITRFTDATRAAQSEYWIGRDPIYVQVIDSNANVDPCCPEQVVVHICDPHEEDDSEYWILDETSSNSPVFFSYAGMQLLPVWDALGIGLAGMNGGYQLQLDNWKFEVFNEDSVYVRYNDVYYELGERGLAGLGDQVAFWGDAGTSPLPPLINRVRLDNDVSFDVMEIADTQVFDGTTTTMYFLDRQGNRVSGYVNSDCIFIEVIDDDQNEDVLRRERIDAFWDGEQNIPFGPMALNELDCGVIGDDPQTHPVNALLGHINMFDNGLAAGTNGTCAKIYVLNPRNGRWAAVDLLETAVGSGDFISVICVDLVDPEVCPTQLAVVPGDTIVAVYQDPSNHSDSAWICIKVGCGGGGTPPGQASTTKFADADGNVVTQYTDADSVYVKVVDPSHAGAASLLAAVEIDADTFDLAPLTGATTDTFITEAISMTDLGVGAGDSITATYTDPTDPTDSSSDTVLIVSSVLDVTGVIAKPNPFETDTTFAFAEGSTGLADTFSVSVYDLAGHLVWTGEVANADELVWDGTNEAGVSLANGPYIFVAVASDGTDTFTYKGTVFIKQ